MVAIGISEFSFGFAFLYELTQAKWGGITAAPILPSLQKEKDEGWDAKLPVAGTPFYYQFKLAQYLERSNATYRKDGTYSASYFRIDLHKRDYNRQHRLLWLLGQQNPDTYYAAPELQTRDEFNDAFLGKQIIPNSRLIPLSKCKKLAKTDGRQHDITFQKSQAVPLFHSESMHIEGSFRGEAILQSYESTRPIWEPVNDLFAKRLLDQTIENVRRIEAIDNQLSIRVQRHLMEEAVQGQSRVTLLRRVSDITSTVFGATIVLVGQSQA